MIIAWPAQFNTQNVYGKIILGSLFERLIMRLNEVASCKKSMISRLFYKPVIKAHIIVCHIVSLSQMFNK